MSSRHRALFCRDLRIFDPFPVPGDSPVGGGLTQINSPGRQGTSAVAGCGGGGGGARRGGAGGARSINACGRQLWGNVCGTCVVGAPAATRTMQETVILTHPHVGGGYACNSRPIEGRWRGAA
jgi:hypothetical protein